MAENSGSSMCDICCNTFRFCACSKCAKCSVSLKVPYVECTECTEVFLCCRCFASGSEVALHKSDHRYRVLKTDFALFSNSNWTAAEELILLDVLYTYGYGNWELIAEKLRNRSPREIQEHYDAFYIEKPGPGLPRVPETQRSLFGKQVAPYRFKLTDVEEPPRCAPQTINYQAVSGYNAARSDFEVEYDANAEQLLAAFSARDFHRDDPSYEVICEVQCAIIRAYNRRLRERQRRKRIVREHGLILIRKTMSWMHRYDRTLTRSFTERMMRFMQFFSGEDFDLLMERLHRAAELRQRISKLNEYRQKGIRTLRAAEVFESLNIERERHKKELNLFMSNPLFNWRNYQRQLVPSKRAVSRPLDIVGLPSYEKLSKQERELCRNVRLVPQSYLELKNLLVAENKKIGYLKLQTARKMLKIDVNKTRKLYDFLVAEGYVLKPK